MNLVRDVDHELTKAEMPSPLALSLLLQLLQYSYYIPRILPIYYLQNEIK